MASARLTKLELQIMETFWTRGACSVREVKEAFPEPKRPAYTTVLTLLARLERRGCVGVSREGQANIYRPRVTREQVTAERLEPLVQGLAAGESVPLILKLVESQGLSAEELRSLRKLLTELEGEARDRR